MGEAGGRAVCSLAAMHIGLDRMRLLASTWQREGDSRAIFAEAYGTMTSNVLDTLESGAFRDPAWVARLLDRFADLYFEAVDAHAAGADCPEAWRIAFDAAPRSDLHPLQHLFLGVSAHINRDLAFALADVLDDWHEFDPMARAGRHDDHEAVNSVIARTIDQVQADVIVPHAPAMGVLDRVLGGVDEWLFSRLIAGWREAVWMDAVDLLESDGASRQVVERRIEARAVRMAGLLDW